MCVCVCAMKTSGDEEGEAYGWCLSKMADWCGLFFQAAAPFLLRTFTKFFDLSSMKGKAFQ